MKEKARATLTYQSLKKAFLSSSLKKSGSTKPFRILVEPR
jgi:hypothetical protein